MRYLEMIAVPVVFLTLFLVGCDAQGREVDHRSPPNSSAGRTADWTKMKKDEFVAAMNRHLAELDRKIDRASEDMKAELREKRSQTANMLDQIRNASADAWESTRTKVLETVQWIEDKLKD